MNSSADGSHRSLKSRIGGLVRFKSKPSIARVWLLSSSFPAALFLSQFSFT